MESQVTQFWFVPDGHSKLNLDQDTLKGSYYANPIIDTPDVSPELREQYGEYYRSNICM